MAISIPIISEFSPKGIDRAVKEFKRLETTGQKAQFAISKAAVPAAAALAGLGALLVKGAKGAEDARLSNQRLAQVLGQMGFETAASRVSNYAEQLERTLAIDADVIRATQTKLATFKNLTASVNEAGGAFDRATLAALDLAAAGFGEAEQNAVQLGKALQDPVKGITALARAGVTFTEQEKEKIKELVKSGQLLEAQNVILSAIEGQVGGTAAASVSSFEKMRLSLDRLAETFGELVLPAVDRAADSLSDFADFAEDNPRLVGNMTKGFAALLGTLVALKGALAFKALVVGLGAPFFLATAKVAALVAVVVGLSMALSKLEGWLRSNAGWFGKFTAAVVEAFNPLNRLRDAWSSFKQAFGFGGGQDPAKALAGFAESGQRHFADLQSSVGSAVAKVNESLKTQDKKLGGSAKAVESYSSRFKKALGEAVDAARERLKDASEEMGEFAESVKGSLLGAFGFGDALEAGKETGGGFLAGLQDQADQVLEYSKRVSELLDLGLSQDALQQVLAAGTEAGSQIAKELIDGGASAIAETNRLVESAQAAADRVGVLAGEKYFGAGVAFAQRVVDGLQARLDALTPALMAKMDALAKRMGRTVDVTVRVNRIVTTVTAGAGNIPALAEGGIVNRPTLALIGEAGPEAVIPLSKMGQQQGGGGDTTINIYSTIADESLPEKLVQALRTYNRTTGPVRIQVI